MSTLRRELGVSGVDEVLDLLQDSAVGVDGVGVRHEDLVVGGGPALHSVLEGDEKLFVTFLSLFRQFCVSFLSLFLYFYCCLWLKINSDHYC